ncbi:5'-methylthioadenosine/S-adenosylhomocysteine nucleosidase [Haliea sp. E17]|uniref:5'-methylthioadenosine/S-adenosylhomocysteine nucleosidase n=1 Tax=Haliea sp. E17 TaxID=3401576 RepID=UPI003AACEA13
MRYLKHIVMVLLLSQLLACAALEQGGEPHYIALVAAYQGEFDNILAGLDGEVIDRVETHNGVEFHIGRVHGQDIVVFKTGIGLTNAAMTTQLAFDHYPIRHLLFSGVAGGLDPSLHKGDLSVPLKWHYYEYGGRFSRDAGTSEGYRIPPFMRARISAVHYGGFFPYAMRTLREGETQPVEQDFYLMDADLVALVGDSAEGLGLVNAEGASAKVLVGSVGTSGMAFNDDADLAAFIRDTWGSASVDMESAAIAQVCWANRASCAQIRAISDVVGNDNPNEFYEFKAAAEMNAGKLLNAVLASGRL